MGSSAVGLDHRAQLGPVEIELDHRLAIAEVEPMVDPGLRHTPAAADREEGLLETVAGDVEADPELSRDTAEIADARPTGRDGDQLREAGEVEPTGFGLVEGAAQSFGRQRGREIEQRAGERCARDGGSSRAVGQRRSNTR